MSNEGKAFVDYMMHDYDPVKAREYYLRTRELKGRKPAAAKPTVGIGRALATTPTTSKKKATTTKTVTKPKAKVPTKVDKPKPTAEETKAKVERLKNKLASLRKVLQQLVKESKARSGIETKTPITNKTAKKPLTAAQKKAAAKRSQEYREKNPTPSDEVSDLEAQIKKVNEKIAKMRAEIAEAKQKTATKQKAKTNSKTASNGR